MKIEDIKFDIPKEPVLVDEKNFDLEKWRLEYPINYFKFMLFINQASVEFQEKAFKETLKISKLYIPEVLYKYYSLTDNESLNEQKLETLENCKIFMSDAKDLNDPFDNKAFFYNPEEIKKHDILSDTDGKIIDDFSTFQKITSLTANNVNSMPMWAHYGKNHAGFCISYDMKQNELLYSCTNQVQYTNERIDITGFMKKYIKRIIDETVKQKAQGKNEVLLRDSSIVYLASYFSNIKHISWSYENEFRCVMAANAEDMPYVPAIPKEIFVGRNCTSTYVDRLKKIAKNISIPIYQMGFDELSEDFNLVPKRL